MIRVPPRSAQHSTSSVKYRVVAARTAASGVVRYIPSACTSTQCSPEIPMPARAAASLIRARSAAEMSVTYLAMVKGAISTKS